MEEKPVRIMILSSLLLMGGSSIFAQRVTDRRTADIRGGSGDGKCTIEVLVDEVAEIEIRGRNAVIRTVNGSPSSFRRFQCNQEMPANPYDFRFRGIDGRGRQDLVQAAGNGRPAVIRIEDSKGGNEGYTFDVMWKGGSGSYSDGGYGRDRYDDRNRNNNRDRYDNNRDRYNDRNSRYDDRNTSQQWNNGWGRGNGWNAGSVSATHTGGDGYFQQRNGRRGRIQRMSVSINSSGFVSVSMDTSEGRKTMSGTVENRDNRRVFARVNGSGVRGLVEIDMTSANDVRRVYVRDEGEGSMSWSR